ncbi:MAG: T9SS type A sorting domain-containing protein, partial [Balneolaceae bacterium]
EFEFSIPDDSEPVSLIFALPDTETEGWTFQITSEAPWVSFSNNEGSVPATVELEINQGGLEEGDHEAMLSLTIQNGNYETVFQIPLTMHLGKDLFVSLNDEEDQEIPDSYRLYQNYPNPFNPSTTIQYDVKERVHVVLRIYNVLGQEVTTLVNTPQTPGRHQVVFDASRFSSGLYLVVIQMGDFRAVGKMMLLK